MRIESPKVFNRTEWEWRSGSHNHAVKIDAGHDGWKTMCGMKMTSKWHLLTADRPARTENPFCKRCLAKTKSTIAIIPNHKVKECFEV